MLTKVTTCAVNGLDGAIVDVEVDLSPGLPAFTVVGLPDAAVQESRERVRAAIRNSGCEFPMQRITVNLAPADLRKQGPSYDLPIAVGILASSGQLPAGMDGTVLLGELSLEGQLRHTDGVLPMVGTARDRGYVSAVVPCINGPEAALVDGVDVIAARSLRGLVDHLRGAQIIGPVEPAPRPSTAGEANVGVNLAAVRGQEQAKRALEVAAAGGHNILMSGPPGSGKTLLARALPSILPPMEPSEALEASRIYSVAGLLPGESPLMARRPFRAPTTPSPAQGSSVAGACHGPARCR